MAKLSKTFERIDKRTKKLQVIVLTTNVEVFCEDEIDDLDYDDFDANLYIDRKFVADISYVLSDAKIFTEMIDDIDWHDVYKEAKEEFIS